MAFALLRRRWSKGTGADGGLTFPLPTGAGGLNCEVFDPLGQPMGGAEVTVSATDAHRVVARGTTDPYGYFLAVLPAGRYSLMIIAEGLTPYRETVDLLDGVMLPVQRVQLEPARPLDLPVPGTWLFDPPHTAIRFIAKHVGMGHVHGRFERFEGGIQVARSMIESRVQVRIDASSITTGNRTRDDHLPPAVLALLDHFIAGIPSRPESMPAP
jgi:hypothetical protein